MQSKSEHQQADHQTLLLEIEKKKLEYKQAGRPVFRFVFVLVTLVIIIILAIVTATFVGNTAFATFAGISAFILIIVFIGLSIIFFYYDRISDAGFRGWQRIKDLIDLVQTHQRR